MKGVKGEGKEFKVKWKGVKGEMERSERKGVKDKREGVKDERS